MHAYDFINRDALFEAVNVEGNEVVAKGGARYRAIQLGGSSHRMTVATLQRLAALVEAGATVIGRAPESSPALADSKAEFSALVAKLWSGQPVTTLGAGRVISSGDVDGALAQIGVAPDFRMSGASADAEVMFVHRKLPDGDLWFLNNRKAAAETVEARFRVTGKQPELWHADTGLSEAVSYRIENGQTVVPLTLDPEGSVFVVFRKAAVADALALKKLAPVTLSTLEGSLKVALQPGRGAPPSITLNKLGSLTEQADPGVKYFSGMATYASTFALPKGVKPGQPLWLNLGEVGELAEVSVNGRHAGYAWHKPYRVDVSAFVKKGANAVEIKVANLWVNRLIGDAQPGATKVTWTAIPTYMASAPLRPSGLIGPVTLEGQAGPDR